MTPDAGTALLDALLVYAEPFANDARIVVLGLAGSGPRTLADRLVELGARSVRTFGEDLDVRDGAFDLAIIPDLSKLSDPESLLARLRRAVDPSGAVIAMARAATNEESAPPFAPALGVGNHSYGELYDLFALQFENVTMTGVVPFEGIVFAQLGLEDEAPAVSVDTRLASQEAPQIFVVIASRDDRALDPYAIVQVDRSPGSDTAIEQTTNREALMALEAAYAAMQLKADLLQSQLEEARTRVVERDVAMTRALELEAVLATAQQTIAALERRLLAAEKGMLERDDQIAKLNAELDARVEPDALAPPPIDPRVIEELTERAERAEAALALNVADLAHVAEAHASETATLEAQLRERAKVIAELEKEIARREQLVRELVTELEEAREGSTNGAAVFEAAPPLATVVPEDHDRLKKKLDELATDVARRDGELVAQGWRITELENENKKLSRNDGTNDDLAKARDELDALRQALTQEHAARVRAESGEELVRARAELAQQAVLLEQMRAR